MRKVIKSFSSDGPVLFIDLEDVDISVLVTPRGSILLNEGFGEDRIDHAVIPENMVRRFFIDKSDKPRLMLEYLGREGRLRHHCLGFLQNEKYAEPWVTEVNSKYADEKNDAS